MTRPNWDYEHVEYTKQRTIIIAVGKRFNINPTEGLDFCPGIIECTYVGAYDPEWRENDVDVEMTVDMHPEVIGETWCKFRYITNIGPFYDTAELIWPCDMIVDCISSR